MFIQESTHLNQGSMLTEKFRANSGRDGQVFIDLLGWLDTDDIATFFRKAAA